MKKLIFMFLAAFILSSCDEFIHDIDFLFREKITLKGKLSKSQKVPSKFSAKSSSNAFTLADAKKVMIFYGNEYLLENINSDGSFSKAVPVGNSTVIAFLTANNEFIGNLFTGGLNFLPLAGIDYNINSIDFSTLTLDGTRVIPQNDPIGKTIIISDSELDFMKKVGVYYESLAKNIDMNNDGKPDVLSDINFNLNTENGFTAGNYGINGSTEPKISSTIEYKGGRCLIIEGFTNWFSKQDRNIMYDAILSGPEDNPHNDLENYMNKGDFNDNELGNSFQLKFRRLKDEPLNTGKYNLLMDNKKFSFNFNFDLNMKDFWVYTLPTLHVNSKGEITNVSLKFQLPDGREVDPKKLLSTSIGVQFNVLVFDKSMEKYKYQQGQGTSASVEVVRQDIMTSLKKDYDFYNVKLSVPIKLSNIDGLNTTYYDMFGNRANNRWLH